jgi:hypothetical protein
MHHLLLVTLSLDDAKSARARESAYSQLMEDDSFCGEGGRFGLPRCDWFVIGGRWSGFLKETLLGSRYQDALRQEFPAFVTDCYRSELVTHEKNGLDKLWHRLGGSGSHPLTRTGYDPYGADDDAMLVTRPLYDHFLKPAAGRDRHFEGDFVDLDFEQVNESFIGRKWIIAVDYHN